MSKIYKCTYCKEDIPPEELVQFEQGQKKKVKKRAHKKCRAEVVNKKEFFDRFFEILEIRPLKDQHFYIVVTKMKSNYNWETMLHALKVKETDVKKNAHMPMPYILKIIGSQLPFSERDLRKEKEKIIKRITVEDNVEEIIVSNKRQKNNNFTYDINKL